MISNKTVLAIIPARGGSKTVPRKNIVNVAGKPLIAWTIETAKQSKYIDQLFVSSEDEEIIQTAKLWGCDAPFRRPFELAQDSTPMVMPILHMLNELACTVPPLKFDFIVLLQPTSPLRSVLDIDTCLEKCIAYNSNSCVSVVEAKQNPYWMYIVKENYHMELLFPNSKSISRRQELPHVYLLNGAVYVAQCEWLLKSKCFTNESTIAYIMPEDRSTDIDTESDLVFAEVMLNGRKND